MRRVSNLLAMALLSVGMLSSAMAQPPMQTRVAPPADCVAPPVRLGVSVHPTGSGLEVDSVQPGSAATRLGLEAGDRILEINGRPARSVSELQQCLRDAVAYHGGHIRVLVENVRGRIGIPGEQLYVTVRTNLLSSAVYPSEPVPVYSAAAGSPY